MLYNFFKKHKIIALDVFIDGRSRREFVGRLTFQNDNYIFEYDKGYISSRNALEIGPDLLKTQRIFKQKELFRSFEDRIPSRDNPAYEDYCRAAGIEITETNKLVLLSRIGKRGPSSFIFEPEYQYYTPDDAKKFRERLELSTREFADLLGVTQTSIARLENNHTTGKEILKIIELAEFCSSALLYFIEKNGKYLHTKQQERLLSISGGPSSSISI
jgi:HipA-like protein